MAARRPKKPEMTSRFNLMAQSLRELFCESFCQAVTVNNLFEAVNFAGTLESRSKIRVQGDFELHKNLVGDSRMAFNICKTPCLTS